MAHEIEVKSVPVIIKETRKWKGVADSCFSMKGRSPVMAVLICNEANPEGSLVDPAGFAKRL